MGKDRNVVARKKDRAARSKKRRNVIIFTIEMIIFLLLLLVIFFLYEVHKMRITELDSDKIATNEAERPSETETTIVYQTDEEGRTIEVAIPITKPNDETNPPITEPGNIPPAPFGDRDYTTLVVFGVDARDHDKSYTRGSNSDVIILVSINNKTGDIKMCSVYRDTYMKLYGMDKYGKANVGFSSYDVYEAINTLNMNLDLNISEFICVDWAASIEMINAMGGVAIELKKEFYEIDSDESPTGKVPYLNGLIQELVNSTGIPSAAFPQEWYDGREIIANGTQAVAYMRLRMTDSDLQRTQRQRNIINQVVALAKKADIGTLLDVWNSVSKYIEVSLTETEILGMLYHLLDYNIVGTHGYPFQLYSGADFTGDMNYNMVTIDMVKNVKQLHAFLYDDVDYEPTSTIHRLSEELRKKVNFNENWEPNFYAPFFSVIDTEKYN